MNCSTRKGGKMKGEVRTRIKNSDGKVNNTEKEKKNRYNNNKKFSLPGKSSGLIPLVFNPGIGVWYTGLCGEG
jgi:hypothetical protein